MQTIELDLLYKYRSFDQSGYNLKALENGDLWFASAKTFNDPFDAAFTYDYEGVDGPIAEQWARSAVSKFQSKLSQIEKDRVVAKRLKEIRNDRDLLEQLKNDSIEDSYKKFGVCSLAGSNDNLLMWAHYGGEHSGFVIGLDVQKIYNFMNLLAGTTKEVIDLFKIDYSDKFPSANFFKTMLNLEDDDYVKLFYGTKSIHWSYEEEHRLVSWDGSNRKFSIGTDAFTQLVLGCRITPENRKNILSICKNNMPSIIIYQAEKNKNRFSLNLIPA